MLTFRSMKSVSFIISFFFTFGLLAQDFDYVSPDSSKTSSKRPTLSLPIKAVEQPVYIVPSYVSEENELENGKFWQGDEESESKKKSKGHTRVGLEMGTSVASDFNGGTAVNTYAAPHVRHEVNDRVAISGGVIMSQTFFNGWKSYSLDGGPISSTVYSNTIYGRVDYRISEDLLVYGAVYQNILTTPTPGLNNQINGMGYSVGMEYKMSDRSFLRVQINRSQGYNPFMPYTNYGFGGRPITYFP